MVTANYTCRKSSQKIIISCQAGRATGYDEWIFIVNFMKLGPFLFAIRWLADCVCHKNVIHDK